MQFTRTSYTVGNSVMLALGTLLALLISFSTAMAFGFGDLSGNWFQKICMNLYAGASVLFLPAFLTTFRWSGIGCGAVWGLTLSCAILALLGGELSSFIGFIVFQVVLSLLASGIYSASDIPEAAVK